MTKLNERRPVLSVLCLFLSIGIGVAPKAEAQTIDLQNGSTLRFYGQFSPSYLTFDDGIGTRAALVDNSHSNTRIGLDYSGAEGPFGSKIGFKFETGLGLRASNKLSQTSNLEDFSWDRTKIRKVDFSLSGDWGKFSIGQGSMATDGAAQQDLTGTLLVNSVSISDMAGSFAFRESNGRLSTVRVKDAFSNYDGGRLGRVRYDSPVFGEGFRVSAAVGTEILADNSDLESADVALTYERETDALHLTGAVGLSWVSDGPGRDWRDMISSFSLHHKDSGIFATIAAGHRSTAGTYGYAKLGYSKDIFGIGTTAFSVDLYHGNDIAQRGSRSDAWGVGIVQKIDKLKTEAYLGYRHYEYSDPLAPGYLPARSVMFGARWKI